MWNRAFNYIIQIKRDYINKFGSLDTLSVSEMCKQLNTKEYDNFLHCVVITNYKSYNLFKYSLILGGDIDLYENPMSIYREMRGFVIDIEKEQIVLAPFAKFFNINEIEETNISIVENQIKNSRIFEIANKMDGSMLSARYYDNEYILGTGSLHLNHNNPRLDECYDWFTKNYREMAYENSDLTFMFEYISLQDKHIVEYSEQEQGLYLIGARNVTNGYTLTYAEVLALAKQYNVLFTTIENETLGSLIDKLDSYKSTEKEGWVIRVDNFMYKVKCTDFVNIHSFLANVLSPNIVIKNIYNSTLDDVISQLSKHYQERIYEIADKVYLYIREKQRMIDYYYDTVKDISDAKEFAIAVNTNVPKAYRSYMFNIRNGMEYSVIRSFVGRFVKIAEIEDFLKEIDKTV